MSAQEPSTVDHAIDLIRSGDRKKAGGILAAIVSQEPKNSVAWYWLSACAPDEEKVRFCLEQALSIDPQSVSARAALEQLRISSLPSAREFAAIVESPAPIKLPDFITLACPTCGAPMKVTKDKERYVCPSCGQQHLLRMQAGIKPVLEKLQGVQAGVDRAADEIALRRVNEEIGRLREEMKANNQLFSRGGSIILTGIFVLFLYFRVLIFTPLLYLGAFLVATGLFFLLYWIRAWILLGSKTRKKQKERQKYLH